MNNPDDATRCGGAPRAPDQLEAALRDVDGQCAAEGLRLTPGRRKVLALLLREGRALGAYDILDRLHREDGTSVKPPIIYRALDFLTEHGFAHRIERMNAFVACLHPGENHAPAFMICRTCRSVSEAHFNLIKGALGDAARASGFQIERTTVEAEGICPACADATPA